MNCEATDGGQEATGSCPMITILSYVEAEGHPGCIGRGVVSSAEKLLDRLSVSNLRHQCDPYEAQNRTPSIADQIVARREEDVRCAS